MNDIQSVLCVLKYVKTFCVNWLDKMSYLSCNNYLFSSLKQLQTFPYLPHQYDSKSVEHTYWNEIKIRTTTINK